MGPDFLRAYLAAFGSIQGMFSYDAALLFMAYNQLIASEGITGDVLEIGVHHGLSSIAVASLRGDGRRFVAVDLFEELQSRNVSGSGLGNKALFLRNLRSLYDEIDFVRPIACASSDLMPADLGSEFSFCHIDGGHSAGETYHDLRLCHRILMPGGLVAVDDYFNPAFPGVCEGAIGFLRDHEDALIPLAIGFNKVLFQKAPVTFDLNARFSSAFPLVRKTTATLWEKPAFLFGSDLVPFFDLTRSTPRHLVPSGELKLGAVFDPQITHLRAERGATVRLPTGVGNRSTIPFQWGSTPFGLSYHLLSSDGSVLQFDNVRSYFTQPLQPGEERVVDLSILAPDEAGSYKLEIDIVWDGILWLKERGNRTAIVDLTVT